MSVGSSSKGKSVPSSNWFALRKQLNAEKRPSTSANAQETQYEGRKRKRQKLDVSPHGSTKNHFSRLSIASDRSLSPSSSGIPVSVDPSPTRAALKNGESIEALQQMTLGHIKYTDAHKLPGKYLALDCEMVGVGIKGSESSLARVSLVNFYGAVVVDEFVRQKERIVDYRTQWSGIREADMVNAKPFEEVQKRVSDLLKDKILIGHAVHNDLKALLLSHPRPQTRDTQIYAHKFKLNKTRYIALRNLVKAEIGLTIQSGEHSSITDARATMAVYRLHKKEWEIGSRPPPKPSTSSAAATSPTIPSKRKEQEAVSDPEPATDVESTSKPLAKLLSKGKGKAPRKDRSKLEYPGGGRKRVSSGLSTVIRRVGGKPAGSRGEQMVPEWWKELPRGVALGSSSKGSITIGMKK
ncbi:hypothetical protein GALMADRAFT_255620 [Galerina marginata CBS 339.88]|uniref:RNA exonuclease 4 n=1 Tax=Galerina marginata (strain CBS 339.88) TaxID=685588 RepID=A0A067SFX7_GALM3|nr:hypothetical protein GALMADRAFT_255620 [Galerina marginata CBS 339.88]